MLFSWVKTDYLDQNFPKKINRTEISLRGNNVGQAD